MTLLILQRFTADLRTLIVTVASLRRRLLCYLTLCVSCSSSPLPLFHLSHPDVRRVVLLGAKVGCVLRLVLDVAALLDVLGSVATRVRQAPLFAVFVHCVFCNLFAGFHIHNLCIKLSH